MSVHMQGKRQNRTALAASLSGTQLTISQGEVVYREEEGYFNVFLPVAFCFLIFRSIVSVKLDKMLISSPDTFLGTRLR